MISLGFSVCDQITGFVGVVTGRAEYITGCTQCLVVPACSPDGSYKSGEWFDEQRLTRLGDTRTILENGATPGCDKAAPKR